MTNLELLICEAENNGEISIDIRDRLLEVINESTALQRSVCKIEDEIDKLLEEKEKCIEKYKKLLQTSDSGKEKERIEKLIKRKKEEYDDKIDKLHDRLDKYKAYDSERKCKTIPDSKNFGVRAAKFKRRLKDNPNLALLQKSFYDVSAKDFIKQGKHNKDIIRETFYSKGNDPNDKKPGRYLDAMKESVDELRELIYESELSGEITPDERALLLLELE